jgi:hypothetical protein
MSTTFSNGPLDPDSSPAPDVESGIATPAEQNSAYVAGLLRERAGLAAKAAGATDAAVKAKFTGRVDQVDQQLAAHGYVALTEDEAADEVAEKAEAPKGNRSQATKKK